MTVRMPEPKGTLLGKETTYENRYDPSLLTPIPRSLGRDAIGRHDFRGVDVWRLYEITWLDLEGRPHYAAGELLVPATSPNIVESKSLKLYIGSFTQTRVGDLATLSKTMERDLAAILGAPVKTRFAELADWTSPVEKTPGVLLERETVPEGELAFEPEPALLTFSDDEKTVEETLSTDQLRSLCPVTGQPDHATVVIRYRGRAWDHEALYRYLLSYRLHRGFHEQCCEQIFHDLMTKLSPETLEVRCLFTRRGGIDISPFRSTDRDEPERIWRAMRQ